MADDEDNDGDANNADNTAGVDDADHADTSDDDDSDFDPNEESSDENDSNEGFDDESEAETIEELDDDSDSDNDDDNNNDYHNEYEPEHIEIAGVDQEQRIAGVNPKAETAGVSSENPYAMLEEEAEEGSNNNGVSERTEEPTQEDQSHQRSYQGAPSRLGDGLKMKLRSQPRKEYDVFNMSGEHETTELIMLNVSNDKGDLKINEEPFNRLEAEWVFLTETLGWKEGLDEKDREDVNERVLDKNKVTLLAEYLFVTEQMGWRKGFKLFGERGESSIMSELKQIHNMEGFQPKHWYEMTKEERAVALKYLMYLKEKRDGRIKGGGCADGRPQRLYTNKTESSSPTATLLGLIMTCVIDAFERRDVATVDIPGAFLQTKMPKDEKDVHVIIDGRMAELLAKIAPSVYQEYVHHKRGQAFIYCKLNVALYGTLKAAILFWKKLTASLKKRGFIINPYDWCIANKDIDGSQCTIVWHVDDLKISHKSPKVVSDIIQSLKEEYGKVGEMTVRRGTRHDYLGMTLDFSSDGKFIIDMQDYIEGILKDLPQEFDGEATTPAADHLFKVRDSAKLSDKDAEQFHHITAQLLFLCKRGRPDIHTAVAFLCTRVKCPDEDDNKKLIRVIRYLRRTKFLRITLEATHIDQNHWFIDGAFAVHKDMRSHSGSCMTFGKGMINGSSNKQKINTTSSTEAEVVAVHDSMSAILWTRYFLEGQGYPMKPSIIHQDNQSAMLLGTNGRRSSSKRTRHMNI